MDSLGGKMNQAVVNAQSRIDNGYCRICSLAWEMGPSHRVNELRKGLKGNAC